jgi:hypothetical protein
MPANSAIEAAAMGFGQAPAATIQNLVCCGQASMVAIREVFTTALAFSGGAYEPPDRDHTVSATSGRAARAASSFSRPDCTPMAAGRGQRPWCIIGRFESEATWRLWTNRSIQRGAQRLGAIRTLRARLQLIDPRDQPRRPCAISCVLVTKLAAQQRFFGAYACQ